MYDDFTNPFTNGEIAFVLQHTNHTFHCLATNTGASVLMRWELFDGISGRYMNHSDGYPMDINQNTLGQVS